jgi:HD-GYP domain-containing protein (c-di-GMP phosphodiesterase class II)
MFQALTQKRPYRDKFHQKEIMSLLKNQMQEDKLDKDVVSMVENNLAACWKIAN